MTIAGYQKLTLLDFPEHVATTIFLAGCNLRCPFCHNVELIENVDKIVPCDEKEIMDFYVNKDENKLVLFNMKNIDLCKSITTCKDNFINPYDRLYD